MVKILKNGRDPLFFTCDGCGCEFISDEYAFVSSCVFNTPSDIKIKVVCPCCRIWTSDITYSDAKTISAEYREVILDETNDNDCG